MNKLDTTIMMMEDAEAIMSPRTKPNVKLPMANCMDCMHKWVIRTEAPKKCPSCFSTKVKVKGV